MLFTDTYLVTSKLQTIAHSEVVELEKRLGFSLPAGYAEFITTLGIGTYCNLLRVYEPKRILDDLEKTRKRREEYFFWEEGEATLSKEQVLNSVQFADTIDGDSIICNPYIPDRLFVLPRHDHLIYWVPQSFRNPLLWLSPNGIEDESPKFKCFESWLDRACIELFTAITTFEVPNIAQRFIEHWANSEIHRIAMRDMAEDEDEGELIVLFIKSIGGRIQIDNEPDDGRVGIRIDYDIDSKEPVTEFAETLKRLGFYETFSY